jgi:CMP-N-acetylneuraminic acid synthetase
MKAIIPAKCNSSRVFDKNWREFYEGESLVEIKISQLIDSGLNSDDIHVFCEDESKKNLVEKKGAKFESRSIASTKDETHWSEVVTGLVSSIDAEDDEPIAWVQAPTPLFGADSNKKVIDLWYTIQSGKGAYSCHWRKFDCIITVKKFKEFVLDENGKPVNFNFGRWHEWSQNLPQWYVLESPIHIMKRKDYLKHNYYIGSKPYLYEVPEPSIDIDEMDEFLEAQELYGKSVLDS